MTSTVFRRISDNLLFWIKNSLIFKLFYSFYLKFKGYFEGSYFVKLMYFFKEKITTSQYTPKESMSIPDRVLRFILEKSIGFLNKNKEAFSVQLIVKIKEMTYKKLVSLNSITLGVYTFISAVLYLLKGSSNLSVILGLLSLGFFLVFYSLTKNTGILSKYLTGDEKLSKIEIIVFSFLGLVPGIFLNSVGFYLATALALGIVFMISVLKETFLAVGAYIFAVVFLPDALTL
ncbi:MAG TPA: hypothetical protein DHM42_11695, partial [Clostridiales bacterium]|nr:hypothetical protein [Clostridiales bacterium]